MIQTADHSETWWVGVHILREQLQSGGGTAGEFYCPFYEVFSLILQLL